MSQGDRTSDGNVTRTKPARVAGVVGLAALAVLGLIATVMSVSQARSEARSRDQEAAAAVAQRFSVSLQSSMSALRGANGVAEDGTVTAPEFAAFAGDVVRSSNYAALAYSEIVPEAQRAEWESTSGHAMVDLRGDQLVPAAPRPVHVAVRHVYPVNDLTKPLLGFDLMGEPVRASGVAAAMATGEAVVGPISLARTGAAGLFVVRAVKSADGTTLGFVSAGISADALLGTAEDFPNLGAVKMLIDGTTLLERPGPGDDVRRVRFDVADRRFVVEAGDRRDASWALALMVGFGSALLWVGAAVSYRRTRRDRQREQRVAERNRRLEDLGRVFAGALSAEQVTRAVTESAGSILDADYTGTCSAGPPDEPSGVTNVHIVVAGTEQPADSRLDDVFPFAQCIRDGAVVATTQGDGPRQDVRTAVCAPLSLGTERSNGAVGFGWRRDLPADELEDSVAATQLVAQMAGRAMERALVRDAVQSRVEQLSELARLLSTARSTDEIKALVARLVPSLLGVRTAVMGATDEPVTGDTRTYAAPHPRGEDLHLVLAPGTEWTPTLQALTEAVVELIEGAWVRAGEQEHEHLVLQRLQASLLLPAPEIDGLDIAVAYRSAIEAVGIGGDWYSVIDRPDVVHLVVGDVAGHGPGAVAIMAECKTILRHLLTTGTPIGEALEIASDTLARRNAYASVVAVTIDKTSETFTYLNAGHPSPVLRTPDGCGSLRDIHRPWLGVAAVAAPPSTGQLPAGSLLLLYTDGLIEDRRAPLDESITALVERIATSGEHPGVLVEHLLEERADHRLPSTVDDDIAVIAVARPAAPR